MYAVLKTSDDYMIQIKEKEGKTTFKKYSSDDESYHSDIFTIQFIR